MKKAEIRAAMLQDIARSGLTERHANKAEYEPMEREEVAEFMGGGHKVSGYAIPYHDWDGKPTAFTRIRLLERLKVFGSGNSKRGKIKYLQKAGTLPHLYIPRLMKWPTNPHGRVLVPGRKLIITEGEKKADAACAAGLPCVALGGVWGFMSKKSGITLLPEFDQIDYTDLHIEICYDTDASSKSQVRFALETLARILQSDKRPKSVQSVQLTPIKGVETTGLDDFLLANYDKDDPTAAAAAYKALPRVSDGTSEGLQALNEIVCFVNQHGKFYNIPYDRFYGGKSDLHLEFCNRYPINTSEGVKPAIEVWLNSRDSAITTVDRLVYEPGKSIRLPNSINIWRPTEMKPRRGTPELWLALLDHLTSKEGPDIRDYLLKWFAYPIQRPGAKLLTSVFMWSKEEGTGKNFLVEPFMWEIYGKSNMVKITVSDLESAFNSYAAKKQFIITDEIFIKDTRERHATMGRLKTLITSPTISINEKYRPPQEYDNFANYYLTSNHQSALPLAKEDRRFLIIESPPPLKPKFYKEMDVWARNGGAATLYWYLLNRVDCTDFNENSRAPETRSREDTVQVNEDPIEAILYKLKEEPEVFVKVGKDGHLPEQELYSTDALLLLVNRYLLSNLQHKLGMNSAAFGRRLRGTLPKKKLSVTASHQRQYYALLNQDKWKATDKLDWLQHVRTYDAVPKQSTVSGRDRKVIDIEEARAKRKDRE